MLCCHSLLPSMLHSLISLSLLFTISPSPFWFPLSSCPPFLSPKFPHCLSLLNFFFSNGLLIPSLESESHLFSIVSEQGGPLQPAGWNAQILISFWLLACSHVFNTAEESYTFATSGLGCLLKVQHPGKSHSR